MSTLLDKGPALVLGERDAGHYTVREGSDIHLRLPQNASTGYQWIIRNSKSLELLETYTDAPVYDAPGTGTYKNWEFVATRTGRFKIEATYSRPWLAPPPKPTHVYFIRVVES